MERKTLGKILVLFGLLITVLAVIAYVAQWVSVYVHVGSLSLSEEVAFDIIEALVNVGFNTGPIMLVAGIVLSLLREE
jgi:hypothetical protein